MVNVSRGRTFKKAFQSKELLLVAISTQWGGETTLEVSKPRSKQAKKQSQSKTQKSSEHFFQIWGDGITGSVRSPSELSSLSSHCLGHRMFAEWFCMWLSSIKQKSVAIHILSTFTQGVGEVLHRPMFSKKPRLSFSPSAELISVWVKIQIFQVWFLLDRAQAKKSKG